MDEVQNKCRETFIYLRTNAERNLNREIPEETPKEISGETTKEPLGNILSETSVIQGDTPKDSSRKFLEGISVKITDEITRGAPAEKS